MLGQMRQNSETMAFLAKDFEANLEGLTEVLQDVQEKAKAKVDIPPGLTNDLEKLNRRYFLSLLLSPTLKESSLLSGSQAVSALQAASVLSGGFLSRLRQKAKITRKRDFTTGELDRVNQNVLRFSARLKVR
jgi:hypothetical protein